MKSDDTHSSDDGSEATGGSHQSPVAGTASASASASSSAVAEGKKDGKGDNFDNLERLRRQKRLAMNRESARNRRKRKKVMLESLEKQVEEMNKVNQNLRTTNDALTTRVAHLEGELQVARNTIAMLSGGASQPSFLGGASGIPGAGGGGPGHLSLLRQGLGGGGGRGLGGSSFLSDPGAFQYMQLLQQQQGGAGTGARAEAGGPDSELLRLARDRQNLQHRLGGAGPAGFSGDQLGGPESGMSLGNSGLGGSSGIADLQRLGGASASALRGGAGSFGGGAADIQRQLAALRAHQHQGGAPDQQDLLDKNLSGTSGSKPVRDP